MKEQIESFDWSSTPIGPRDAWPQSLRTSLSICLASRFPILIWWGPELIKLYNDAYAVILGDKHPKALGARGRDVWPEIWHIIGPMLDQVRLEGKATWSDDQLLMLNRHGYAEECYFTFSYSPILDESGGVGGVFTAVTETTTRVVGERRLETLRLLAGRAAGAKSVEEACRDAAEILAANPRDVPFAAIYLRDAGAHAAQVCVAGEPPADLPATMAWFDAPAAWNGSALVLPLVIPGDEQPVGQVALGISPNRRLNDAYRTFFTLVAGHIASAIANAKAYEIERQRAEALAELDRAKTTFFSNVSHEFRTPLTLMLAPLEDTLSDATLSLPAREKIELAHRNAVRLLKLVNTLLDFSRLESGRIHASYEPVDLSALTTELASVFRSAIERAGLRLVVNCPPLPQPVYVDREMWERIVLNLLSNAFKFTFTGEIEVSLRPNGDRVELSVRDTGTGIPADQIPHLFERFHRVHGAKGRTYEGSGIGLAMVQELAKLHGGSANVESESGRGSTFTVTVPFGRAHLSPDRITTPRAMGATLPHREAWVEEALRWLPDDQTERKRLAIDDEAPKAAPATHPSARILIADDNADMREYLRRLLASRYDVETAVDGMDALESVHRRAPDLILSDVMMPRMDGFALLRAVREDTHTRGIPIILLSARAGEESKVEGIEAGADDYLTKPFSAKELLARVDGHLRLQRVRREGQEALRASEAKFSTAFDRSPLALTITSLDDGKLVEVNEGFVKMSGFSRFESIDHSPEELGLWVNPEVRAERFESLRKGLPVPDIEGRFRLKNGEERIGMIGSALVQINGRRCVLSSIVDITARKQAEEAVRESERLFREFADSAPAMLWITDANGLCSFVSRGWYEFTGQSEPEALGFGWLDAVRPEDRQMTRDAFLTANANHGPFAADFRLTHRDGDERWVSGSGRPRFAPDGQFLGYVGSVIDITDRKHAEESKDAFLATLSHELRTPLTSGFGWVKLLSRSRDSEMLDTGLHAIEQSFVNQMKLIDDLLDVSRIASGKLHLEMQPLDLGAVVDAAVEMMRPSAESKNLDLRVHLESVVSVSGDTGRLKQIVLNLLSNAIKFTRNGQRIDVEVRRRDGHAEVVVRDSGEGIDPEFLPHVFDRFQQGDTTLNRRYGGLGLGLSIVRSLVESHGGTVRAESEGQGKGATFTVSLPLLAQRTALADLAADRPREASGLAGARVIIVDDDEGARGMMTTTLRSAGAVVRECSSVDEAFDAVADWRPDILVSDLAMPVQDGYSLIRRIREAGNLLPAVAITAHVRPEDAERVLEAGFQRQVSKPFDPDDLVAAVRDLARL